MVSLLEQLLEAGAVVPQGGDAGDLGLGPAGARIFAGLGIDVDAHSRAKRRFAFECDDWTEDGSHLGGALGAALCRALVQKGWIARKPGTRAMRVMASGRRQLGRLARSGRG